MSGTKIYALTHRHTITRIKDAIVQAKASEQRAKELICELFPVGSQVQWMHGDNIRSGVVKDSCGLNASKLRFNIKSNSGRKCWIGASRLLSFVDLEYEKLLQAYGNMLELWKVICCDINVELHVISPNSETAKKMAKEHFDDNDCLNPHPNKMTCKLIKRSADDPLRGIGVEYCMPVRGKMPKKAKRIRASVAVVNSMTGEEQKC